MQKVTWYRRRLATMSAAEIGWRVRSVVAGRVRRLSAPTSPRDLPPGWTIDTATAALADLRTPGRRPALLAPDRVGDVLDRHPGLREEMIAAAEDAVALRCTFFGYPTVTVPRPVDWSHDLVRDVHWPDLPADRIDHRTIGGDVKWIWELNRLQHLPLLAQTWLVTGDDRYADAALDDLDSWIAANPPGHGIAWRGAFEAGIRAVSVAITVVALADAPSMRPERFGRMAAMLDASARYCVRGRSRFSSANNHLVGELAGLAAVALLIPGLDDGPRWEHIALQGLSEESDRQILPDGVGAEQAVGYQIFTAELLAVVAALVADRDGVVPARLVAAVLRGGDFLGGLGAPAPRIGDDDEGFAIRLTDEPVRSVEGHLGLVAAFTDGPAAPGEPTSPAREWFAAALRDAPRPREAVTSTDRRDSGSTWHPDGGLVVLRAPGRRVTVDVAPLGYLAIAAHGHADALAVTVADEVGEIVEDPGTGSYYGHPAWRRVLRGTAAHATVTVDGRDQSDMGGPFLWTRHARTRVRAVDLTTGVVDAEHDGYAGGSGGVVHRRWVIAPPDGRLPGVLIVDRITGVGAHEVATTFPLADDVDVDAVEGGFALSRSGSPVAVIRSVASTPLRPWSVRGDETTHRGWSSRRLEQRTPSWWVGMQSSAETTPVVLATFINVTTEFALGCDLSLLDDGSTIRIRLLCEGVRRDCVVDTRGDGRVSFVIETAP